MSLSPPSKHERRAVRRCLRQLRLDPAAIHHPSYSPHIYHASLGHPALGPDDFMLVVGILAARFEATHCHGYCHDPTRGAAALEEWGHFRDIQRATQRWRKASQYLLMLEQGQRLQLREGDVGLLP